MTATFGDASEAAFITRLRAGEPDAFEQLVRNYTPPLLRVARGYDDEAREPRPFCTEQASLDTYVSDALQLRRGCRSESDR